MMLKVGDSTPWGPAQTVREVGPGIELVTTSSHGGFYLDAAHYKLINIMFPDWFPFCGQPGWFEEDCDAAIVVLAFPASFTPEEVGQARDMIRSLGSNAISFPDTRQLMWSKCAERIV